MLPRLEDSFSKKSGLLPTKMHSSLTAVHCICTRKMLPVLLLLVKSLNPRPTLIFLKAFENIICLSTSVCSNGSLTAVFLTNSIFILKWIVHPTLKTCVFSFFSQTQKETDDVLAAPCHTMKVNGDRMSWSEKEKKNSIKVVQTTYDPNVLCETEITVVILLIYAIWHVVIC